MSTLVDGYTDLPNGKIANVVTCLRMGQRPAERPDPLGHTCTLRRVTDPDPAWYRELFRRVGGPFLWFSRLELNDEDLVRVTHDPLDEIYAVELHGEDVGLLELDFHPPNACRLLFFGLSKELVGRGIGRWLMNRALELAWSRPITLFLVQTCTLDHPSALPFYIRSGFVPFKREIEVADDPRLNGLLPQNIAPDIPLL